MEKNRPIKLCKYLILNFVHFLEEFSVDIFWWEHFGGKVVENIRWQILWWKIFGEKYSVETCCGKYLVEWEGTKWLGGSSWLWGWLRGASWLGGDQTFNKADRGSYAAAYMEVKLMVTSTNNNQWPTTYPLYGRIWTLTPGITLKEVIWKCSKWFGLLMSSRTGSQRCSNVEIRSKSKFGFLCLPSHVIGSRLVRLMFQKIYLQGAMQYRDRLQRRWTLW